MIELNGNDKSAVLGDGLRRNIADAAINIQFFVAALN